MSIYGFSARDAGRIRRAVKKVERDEKALGAGYYDFRLTGTLQKCKAYPDALKANSSAMLPLFDGPPGYEQQVGVIAVHYRLGSSDIPAGKWVFCIDGEVIAAQC